MSGQEVKLHFLESHVVMDNGIVQVRISNPEGIVTGIEYNGIDNLLEVLNDESNRGYWDVVWSPLGSHGTKGTFERYILLRGSSGFYSYAIYEHLEEWPGFHLDNTRIAFKLRKDKFHYMAMSNERQRYMPSPDDRLPGRGQELAYPEAVLLVDPVEPEFKGQVNDKYQYSCENKDLKVHGWISMDSRVGFWLITPSSEFRSGGPTKQYLTSHVGPTTLAMFISAHYAGSDLVVKVGEGEPWKKVYGPVFMYLNSVLDGEDPLHFGMMPKIRMLVEVQKWPYNFPTSEDFQSSEQRGNISGRLLVRDRYISDDYISGNGAYVGLAPPGDVGSWQRECKNYQFWTEADNEGSFSIGNINTGEYNLYAWVPGFLGDYRYHANITIVSGSVIEMGDLVYEPPRDGPTLWEIGIPDRSAAEFYVPDPNPKYTNNFLTNDLNRFRQYGLWERYSELYPDGDLVYTIGESDYSKDWFFAHVNRKKDNNAYETTTWRIKFDLNDVNQSETYKLRLALASAHQANLQVRVNDLNTDRPVLSTGVIGGDNAIARHGIHGLYWLYNVDIPGLNLHSQAENTIYLTQTNSGSPFPGVMYDYIRLEGPLS